jgi:hypothetical protein
MRLEKKDNDQLLELRPALLDSLVWFIGMGTAAVLFNLPLLAHFLESGPTKPGLAGAITCSFIGILFDYTFVVYFRILALRWPLYILSPKGIVDCGVGKLFPTRTLIPWDSIESVSLAWMRGAHRLKKDVRITTTLTGQEKYHYLDCTRLSQRPQHVLEIIEEYRAREAS